jgi:hypothetical protein
MKTNSTEKLKARRAEIQEKLPLEEQKREKKFLFQIISHKDGKRSEPFITSWDDLHKLLNENKESPDYPGEDYLLLVSVLDGEDTIIPATPIIKISTFAAMAAKEA